MKLHETLFSSLFSSELLSFPLLCSLLYYCCPCTSPHLTSRYLTSSHLTSSHLNLTLVIPAESIAFEEEKKMREKDNASREKDARAQRTDLISRCPSLPPSLPRPSFPPSPRPSLPPSLSLLIPLSTFFSSLLSSPLLTSLHFTPHHFSSHHMQQHCIPIISWIRLSPIIIIDTC